MTKQTDNAAGAASTDTPKITAGGAVLARLKAAKSGKRDRKSA